MTDAEKAQIVGEITARTHLWMRGKYDDVGEIETDSNTPPGGTSDYDGRAQAFIMVEGERGYRVTIEEVTIDGEPYSLKMGHHW